LDCGHPLHDGLGGTLACEIAAWMQMLALHGHPARRWQPRRLRLRLLSAAGQLAARARITGAAETTSGASSHSPGKIGTATGRQRSDHGQHEPGERSRLTRATYDPNGLFHGKYVIPSA
jgi:hypothetical protein